MDQYNRNRSNGTGGRDHLRPDEDKNAELLSSKRKTVSVNWLDWIASVVNFVLTFLLIRSVYVTDFGFSWRTTASYLGFFALASFYIISKQKRFRKRALLPGIFAVIASFSFALHGNYEVNTAVFVMLIFLSGMYCVELTDSGIHNGTTCFYLLDVLHCEVFIPIRKIFMPITSFFSCKRETKKRVIGKRTKTVFSMIIGLLFSILVLRFVLPLLISSDSAFENFISPIYAKISAFADSIERKLVEWLDSWNEYIFMDFLLLIPTVVFAPYIFSVMFSFRHGIAKKKNKDTSKKYERLRFVRREVICVCLGIVSLVYLVYFITQAAYLFGAFLGKLPDGVELSVSAYARRGFSDLMKIAVINFILVFLSVLFARREENKLPFAVKLPDVFLCAATILFSVISISKILLYISSYGLTEKRLYVFAADVVLIGVFVAVIVRLFKEKFPYLKVILVLVCSAVTLLGILGADNLIAKYNTAAYLSGKHETVDCEMLNTFDESGFESLLKLYLSDKSNPSVKSELYSLYWKHADKFDKKGKLKPKYKYDVFEGIKNLDEYRMLRLMRENKNLVDLTAYHLVDVFLETEKGIQEISVHNGRETCTVQNADGSLLEGYNVYWFEFYEKKTEPAYKITVTAQSGKVYHFVSDSGSVTIRNSKKGKLILEENQ